MEQAESGKHQQEEERITFRFNGSLLTKIGKMLKECYTRPNKQDYFYLGTKTFGLNLFVRILFIKTPFSPYTAKRI